MKVTRGKSRGSVRMRIRIALDRNKGHVLQRLIEDNRNHEETAWCVQEVVFSGRVCRRLYIIHRFMLMPSMSILGVVTCEPLCPEVLRQQFCGGCWPLHVSCTINVMASPVS